MTSSTHKMLNSKMQKSAFYAPRNTIASSGGLLVLKFAHFSSSIDLSLNSLGFGRGIYIVKSSKNKFCIKSPHFPKKKKCNFVHRSEIYKSRQFILGHRGKRRWENTKIYQSPKDRSISRQFINRRASMILLDHFHGSLLDGARNTLCKGREIQERLGMSY